MFEREKKKNLSLHEKLTENIYVSRMEGLSLVDYVRVCSFICKNRHRQPCTECDGKVKVAEFILQHSYIKLSDAFAICSPGITKYSPKDARRKLLQLPLTAIGAGDQKKGTYALYLVKKDSNLSYSLLQSLLNKVLNAQNNATQLITKQEVERLLNLADSESEKARLRYSIVKSSGISSTKAKRLYGFKDMTRRIQCVHDAAEKAHNIRLAIEKIAHIKEKALVEALGIAFSSESETSDSESEEETDNNDCIPTCRINQVEFGDSIMLPSASQQVSEGESYSSVSTTLNAKSELEKRARKLLDVLRNCELNWFQFKSVARESMEDVQSEMFEEMVTCFYNGLSSLEMSESEKNIVRQSYHAYNLRKSQEERVIDIEEGNIVSESDESSSDDVTQRLDGVTSPFDDAGIALIKKRRAAIRRKATRVVKKRIAEERLLRRRKSKKVSRILEDCSDIGKTIEDFVHKCGAGADAWRRTGVVTFDGNKKIGKKATFKRVKEHLEEKYQRKISYGSVVQLCIARNKRRRSSARYMGVAKVIQKRARKGFNVKYNPDAHWSNALYSSLDALQYQDGSNIVNIGRDDQAGFRLDTMASHRLHGTLCVKGNESLTTRTDYVNKYPSTLQTTSYNFAGTKTTGEICMGVVKAPVLYEKNSAQHLADMELLSQNDHCKSTFINPETGKQKQIECVRVDGGYDEGPPHLEVQYWWTVRHLKCSSHAELVTSRNSGASFRNRVELQNGCLALGHANLFIPSTLHGSCTVESGKVNEEVLKKNLSSAIDVYISRVDKAPCASTEIHLVKGAESNAYQEENKLLKVFLKGKKEEKEELKRTFPDMYSKFEKIWRLRDMHMRKDLPVKYVFFLVCCYGKDCIHEVCKKGQPEKQLTWYEGGPPITYFPLPRTDPERPYGDSSCKKCTGTCNGHYLKPEVLLELQTKENASAIAYPSANPPSSVILDVFKTYKKVPSPQIIEETAEKVLLSKEETQMWFEHLNQIAINKAEGVRKAAETRKRKKAKERAELQSTAKQTTDDSSEPCLVCEMENPPFDGADEVTWIGCDGCQRWCHISCANIEVIPDTWLCINCSEVW